MTLRSVSLVVHSRSSSAPQQYSRVSCHRAAASRAIANGIAYALMLGIAALIGSGTASAHGFAGKRFFPATLTIDDPFVADELALPTIESRKVPNDSGGNDRVTTYSMDFAKRITENLAIGFGATYIDLHPEDGDSQHGWDNWSASFKYKFYQNDAHETIVSAGVDWDIANTGAKRVGAENFHTFTPAIFFGKGFGDLDDSMKFFRPFALTGTVGVGIPSRASDSHVNDDGDIETEQHPHTLEWGFALEYSIPYLQSFVQDMGWREPFNKMIPVIEFPMSTALDRGASGTTGTVNPGIIWAGQKIQLAIEAVVPVNKRSGSQTGVIAQLHWYLDDIFPGSLGQPMVH